MQPIAGLLALFLFLSFVNSCIGDTGHKTVVVFKGDTTNVPRKNDNGTVTMRKPKVFHVSAFVGGVLHNKEFLTVLCDARYDEFSDSLFTEPAVKTSHGNYTKWSAAEIFANSILENGKQTVWRNVTAVMKGNKIYAFATTGNKSKSVLNRGDFAVEWEPVMFVGTITVSNVSRGDGVHVKWEKGMSLQKIDQTQALGAQKSPFFAASGNGIITTKGAIIFPIQMKHQEGRITSSIMYSTNDGSTWHIGRATENATTGSQVVEWGNKSLLFTVSSNEGYCKVYESGDMGTTWKESPEFSGVWGNNSKSKSAGSQGSVITAPVDGKNILLFSHPLNIDASRNRNTLQLWVSDGKRIRCVGKISDDDKGKHTGNSILAHVGENLYVTHEFHLFGQNEDTDVKLGEWGNTVALTPLPQLFESAKKNVRAWRKLDEWFLSKGVPADELVGFWGNATADDVWADVYKCVNATVKGGKRVSGGFCFSGAAGSGAEWPVQNQGENQVYKFTEKEFTFAATVTVHNMSGGKDVLLFGATEDAREKNISTGLGYTKDRKWYTVHGSGSKTFTEISVVLDKAYHVALIFANGSASVFVNGVDIAMGERRIPRAASISHFFMGGSCTVRNAMLFKRALAQREVTELSKVRTESIQIKSLHTMNAKGKTVTDSRGSSNRNGSVKIKEGKIMKITGSMKNNSMDNAIHDKVVEKFLHEYRVGAFEREEMLDDGAVGPMLCFVWAYLVYFTAALV